MLPYWAVFTLRVSEACVRAEAARLGLPTELVMRVEPAVPVEEEILTPLLPTDVEDPLLTTVVALPIEAPFTMLVLLAPEAKRTDLDAGVDAVMLTEAISVGVLLQAVRIRLLQFLHP
jgi:hypothetical protein